MCSNVFVIKRNSYCLNRVMATCSRSNRKQLAFCQWKLYNVCICNIYFLIGFFILSKYKTKQTTVKSQRSRRFSEIGAWYCSWRESELCNNNKKGGSCDVRRGSCDHELGTWKKQLLFGYGFILKLFFSFFHKLLDLSTTTEHWKGDVPP